MKPAVVWMFILLAATVAALASIGDSVPESTCDVQPVHWPMHKIQPPMLDWTPRST